MNSTDRQAPNDPAPELPVVAGGAPGDFMTVRHLVARGTQQEIGRALAREALARFPVADVELEPTLTRARRRWMEHNWPEHRGRMDGMAAAMGVDISDDSINAVDLPALPFDFGCSVLWCPPDRADDGRGRFARNFDFRTDGALEIFDVPADVPQPPMMSAPYVIETYPTDQGLASVLIGACDLSGCFEGINEAGLSVAVLADDESTTLRPTMHLQAGVHEIQLPRLVLDQCRDVEEAIETLRCVKQYDNMFSCHYFVADRHGDAFVWERDTHNGEHVVRATSDESMCITNYLVHRYDTIDALPDDIPDRPDALPFAANMYQRSRTLDQRARSSTAPLTVTDLEDALDAVAVPHETLGARTLWRTTFDPEARSMSVEFYLGDRSDGTDRRSDPVMVSVATRDLATA